ncbi:SRPBCC family protein [Antarctobacter jejuensis]|uniref:SRPBCC family protein n=1 Tax=Antarctobacter jejuensis TaxID=1439938 RepID=UPI003FD39C04
MPLTTLRLSPTSLQVTRRFDAAPARVWQAHVNPDLIPRWLTGPDGWAMTRCEMDMRPGGTIRYRWEQTGTDAGFDLTADVLAVEAPTLMRHVEIMHLPDPTPPTRVETRVSPQGAGTLVTMILEVDDPATLDGMIAHGMADGMEMSYARLDSLLTN